MKPLTPHLSCGNVSATILECPTLYGSQTQSSDGGQRARVLRARKLLSPASFSTVIDNLYSGRTYYFRVLARNGTAPITKLLSR
jgi:hypothetical protein